MNYLDCLKDITNFEDTKKILFEKNLIIKEYDNLFLVKYDKSNCDMTNTDVNKCRGIVLEKNTNNLVCVPPSHSHNVSVFNNININDTTFREFVDGTMINIE